MSYDVVVRVVFQPRCYKVAVAKAAEGRTRIAGQFRGVSRPRHRGDQTNASGLYVIRVGTEKVGIDAQTELSTTYIYKAHAGENSHYCAFVGYTIDKFLGLFIRP